MQITSYDYSGRFLEQFEKSQRSTVANWYCYAYRVAPGTLDDLIEGMRQTCLKKARDYQAGTNWTPAWLDHMQEQDLLVTQLREVLETDESYNFAEFIIARENLPEAEKQRLKALRADEQRIAYKIGIVSHCLARRNRRLIPGSQCRSKREGWHERERGGARKERHAK
jgi:hypothetical protein